MRPTGRKTTFSNGWRKTGNYSPLLQNLGVQNLVILRAHDWRGEFADAAMHSPPRFFCDAPDALAARHQHPIAEPVKKFNRFKH